jgi:predicted HicB family RNase H-like nuclease
MTQEVICLNKMMEYKGYHAKVEYDADDGFFVGKVYGISDSLNFHGTSVTELEEMFHQSVDNYLQMCAETGKQPDKEFKGSFNVRISPDLHRQISIYAAQEGLTLNQYVVRALESSCRV